MKRKLIKDGISHTAIRHSLLPEFGVECRHSKTVLGKSKNFEYDLKRIEELKHRATKSPKFILNKLRWMWLPRKHTDNPIFRNQSQTSTAQE